MNMGVNITYEHGGTHNVNMEVHITYEHGGTHYKEIWRYTLHMNMEVDITLI